MLIVAYVPVSRIVKILSLNVLSWQFQWDLSNYDANKKVFLSKSESCENNYASQLERINLQITLETSITSHRSKH